MEEDRVRVAPLGKGGRTFAAALSFIAPGAGQAFAGQIGAGIAFAVVGVFVGVLAYQLLVFVPGPGSLALPVLVVLGYRIWSARSAYRDRSGKPNRWVINRLGNAVFIVVITFVLTLFLRGPVFFLAQHTYRLPSSSMSPLLLAGDYVITVPLDAEPRRGQVVVFLRPDDTTSSYVKRIIAGPGDTIEMRERKVYLNNRLLPEAYAHYEEPDWDPVMEAFNWQARYLAGKRSEAYKPSRHNWGPLVLPRNSWFLMGDDRDNSADSRFFGFVPRFLIVGEPKRVYFSADSLRRIRWSRLGKSL